MEDFNVDIKFPKELALDLYKRGKRLSAAIGGAIATSLSYNDTIAVLEIPEEKPYLLSKMKESLENCGGKMEYKSSNGRTFIRLDFSKLKLITGEEGK